MAQRLAALIADYETVVLDAGSTAFLVAQELAGSAQPRPSTVITNNFAVSLVLGVESRRCIQLGGVVDDLHLCVISEPRALNEAFSRLPRTASVFILTGAAFEIARGGLAVRARRPDQFEFKKAAVAMASKVLVAAELPKFYLPFDGQYDFTLSRPDADVWLGCSQGDQRAAETVSSELRELGVHVTVVAEPPG